MNKCKRCGHSPLEWHEDAGVFVCPNCPEGWGQPDASPTEPEEEDIHVMIGDPKKLVARIHELEQALREIAELDINDFDTRRGWGQVMQMKARSVLPESEV